MKKTIALLVSVILAVGMLAACASDSSSGVKVEASVVPSDEVSESPSEEADASEEASSESAAETSESAQTSEEAGSESSDGAAGSVEAEGEVLKRIIERGKMVMLTNAAFPPYEYRNSDGSAEGVDVDLCQAIADQIGVELEVTDMEFDSLIPALLGGTGDIVAAGVTVTDERKESVDFSDTYADAKQLIIVPKEGATVASEEDLPGKRIGVQLGTTGDLLASDVEGAQVSQYRSGLEAALDLSNGQLDCVVLDKLPAESIVAQNDNLQTLDMASTDEQYAVAVAKDNQDFLDIINAVIAEKLEDGSLADSTAKHIEAAKAG